MTRLLISALVIVHLVATIWHGDAHKKLSIELEPSKTIFVYAVILIGPVVAALLVWTRFMSAGLWVFALSMLGAFCLAHIIITYLSRLTTSVIFLLVTRMRILSSSTALPR